MGHFTRAWIAVLLLLLNCAAVLAQTDQTTWVKDAKEIYDTGFMQMLRKAPNGGVGLFGIDLIENDSPGAGVSEKGPCSDFIWGTNQARKILRLNDARTHKATLFVFSNRHGNHPLRVTINGHESQIEPRRRKTYERFHWIEFPAEWLQQGDNVVELSCPEAHAMREGWEIWLARADEFAEGGGDPRETEKTSYRSTDSGKSWKQSPFAISTDPSLVIDGFDLGKFLAAKSQTIGEVRAEYCVRISLNRYVSKGWLESPVIDLWKGNSSELIARTRSIQKLKISIQAQTPEETAITYFLRKGTHPSPYDKHWEDYIQIGSGPTLNAEILGSLFNRRFLQLKAVLTTNNPLKTPVLQSVRITANFKERFPVPRHQNLFVLDSNNPPIQYPSIAWKWESWDRPEFQELRTRENLDAVIAGSRTSFESQIKLLDYATKRWRWTSPLPEYPAWDALSILDRVNKYGGAGMCIQFNNLLAGACMAYGWQARLVSIDAHEVCEVWNDDYGKWIYLDASGANHYQCDLKTGEPLSMLELHRKYLDYYYKDRVVDWLNDPFYSPATIKKRTDKPQIVRSSTTYNAKESKTYTGFTKARIIRVIPRNNWYESPFPRPLSHGSGSHWPWNGYLNWYDEKTPPRPQYSWYTDRPQDIWPDLNTVHIHTTQAHGNDRLFLQFETYTPNFSHFEVNTDAVGWRKVADQYTWLLVPGKNQIRCRAVNKLGVRGRPSSITLNHVVVPFQEWEVKTLKSRP